VPKPAKIIGFIKTPLSLCFNYLLFHGLPASFPRYFLIFVAAAVAADNLLRWVNFYWATAILFCICAL
jgi:hypothetical protein